MFFDRFSKLIFCFLASSLATAVPVFSADPVKPKAVATDKQLHCWRFVQKNLLFGDCIVYASPEALKIEFTSGKWLNIARAPDWELFVANPKEKIYFHTPLSQWKANKVQLGLANSIGAAHLVHTKNVQIICGLVAVQIVPRAVNAQGKESDNGSYWVARDLKLPDQVSHVLCGNALCPQLHAIPLRVCSNTSLGNSVETSSAKQVDLPNSFFDMPKGFKETKHSEDVMNTGVMDVVKDMAGY